MGLDGYAALLIDMQPSCTRILPKEKRTEIIRAQKDVLRYCRKNDVPTIVLENIPSRGITISELSEIASQGLLYRFMRYKLVRKPRRDGFKNTGLEKILRGLGACNLVVMGLIDMTCVMETCKGALRRGFKIQTAEDLIGGSDEGVGRHKWFIDNGIYFGSHYELLKNLESLRKFYEP